MKTAKPTITPTTNGPYLVEDLENFRNSKDSLEPKPKMALCRCGGSANKPFCDGTHARNGFSDKKQDDRVPDRQEDLVGNDITIHDNRGICAHAGRCTDGLPSVFQLNQEPWIDPRGAPAQRIAETIRQCPSGALSYSTQGNKTREVESEPSILVSKDGPYVITGGPELAGIEWADRASRERFTLCRCGGSKNKPFCDGTHWHIEFHDEKN